MKNLCERGHAGLVAEEKNSSSRERTENPESSPAEKAFPNQAVNPNTTTACGLERKSRLSHMELPAFCVRFSSGHVRLLANGIAASQNGSHSVTPNGTRIPLFRHQSQTGTMNKLERSRRTLKIRGDFPGHWFDRGLHFQVIPRQSPMSRCCSRQQIGTC